MYGNYDMSVANEAFSILKKNQFYKYLVTWTKLYVHITIFYILSCTGNDYPYKISILTYI